MVLTTLTKRLVTASVCLLLIVNGLVLLLANHNIFLAVFRSQMALSPTSGTFPVWKDLPFPMPTSFYLFHVLNPDQVSQGAKPRLEERGPYTFYEQHHKTGLVWNKNGTITYQQMKTWHFDPDLSNGTLEDRVTIINTIAAGLGPMIELQFPNVRWPVNFFINSIQEKLFINATVGEILFDGVNDPLFDQLETLIALSPAIAKMFPPGLVMDKFAFFYGRNGTSYGDGVWNMYTGVEDVQTMGQVNSWNFSSRNCYPGQCGQVRGSAGEFFPPGQKKTFIELYSPDLCRPLRFQYNKEIKVAGVDCYEYIPGQAMFANGSQNSMNLCYEEPGVSLPSGVFNSSLCRAGAPVFISQPHFYQADPYFLSLLEGSLAPDKEKHSSFIRLEPVAGSPVDVNVRMQVNVMLAPVQGINLLENVSKSFFPVLWSENAVKVPDSLGFKIKLMANLTFVLSGVGWVCVGLMASILITFTLFQVTMRDEEEDRSPILSQSLQEESGDENVFLSNEED